MMPFLTQSWRIAFELIFAEKSSVSLRTPPSVLTPLLHRSF